MDNKETEQNGQGSEQKKMGALSLLVKTITSPGEAMAYISAHPTFLWPIIIVALHQLILLGGRYSLFKDTLKETIVTSSQQYGQPVPTGQELETLTNISANIALAFAPIMSVIYWLAIAFLVFILVKIFKGEGTFKQYLSIAGYAHIIVVIYYLLSLVISFSTGQLYLDSSLANISNIFAPELRGSYLYGIIRSLDFFTIWFFLVIGMGANKASNRNNNIGYIATAIVFVLYIIVSAFSAKLM